MGIPPPRMPWWYPLSLMKAVIKFTSALPAQFLMAGLANYVDFEMNSLQFDVEKYATFTIQHTNFRSVLFAAVDLPSAPSNSRGKRSLSLHASHQRHSIKRAEHLFKEKFLEIVITSGPISLVQIASAENETENIVNLPSGMHIAVSCHFSAGCVTLKDVDANTMIETVKLNTNHLLELLKSIKQSLPPKSAPVPDQNLEKPPKTVKLLHSASLSIRDTIIETKHAEDCFSTLNIKDMCLTGIVENEVLGIDPYLKALYTTKLVSWTITDNSIAITKRRLTEVIVIPSIAFNATISQSVIAKKKYDQMDTLPETFIGILEGDDLIPNKQFVNLSINVDHPKIFLDISKISTFKKLSSNLQRRQNALQAPSASPRNSKEFYNLPRASLAITVEYPSIYFRSLEKSVGLISWSELNFDVSGAYFVERNRPTSIISNFSEPNISAVDHTNLAENEEKIEYHVDSSTIQKLHSPTRPSWTNLFRRSWRPKEADGEHKKSNSLGWRYKASSRFIMQHTCLDAIAKKEGEQPLILIKDIELSVKANFNVTFFNEEDTLHQQVKSSWDPYEQHHDVRITVDKTVLNLYSETETGTSQLDFWVNNIANEIKSNWPSKTKNPSNTKNQRIYQHILTTRIQFELNNSSLILKGLDQGLKGKRPVPEGYIDNAPEEDINACLVLSLDYFSVLFNGSRVSIANRQMHRYSANVGSVNNAEAENDGKENGHALLGSIRVSLQEMAVKRMFGNKIDSWQENNDKQFMVLWIPHVNIRTNMTKTSDHILLSPSIVVKKIGIQYTISNHYALLITVLSTKQFVQKVIKKEDTRIREKKPSSVVFSKLQLQANRTDVHVSLPDTTKLYVRMDSLRTEWLNDIEHRGEMPSTAIRNLTVYGVAPEEERQWEQLLEIDNLQLSIEKDMDLATGVLSKVYQLSLSKFYLRIPYKYELCHVLDNAVNLMKVIKASHSRLLKGVSFLYFGPTEKKEPISIPDMRLICDLFTFQLEDDPFEVRLRSIWKTGIVEQANRVALQDAFDLKAKTLTPHQFSETSEENKNTDIKYDARVHEALRGLQEHNSKSWKRHIDTAISKEKSAYEKIRTADYRSSILPDQLGNVLGNDEGINEDYANIFYINIVSLPHYSPLLDVTIRNTQLDFRRPDFNLEKTREFIYDLGKGQPLDTPLSTLIPFHLDWKAGATWVQIRDYPLPFVLVPPTSPEKDREQENTYSWSLSGNYALADTLGDLDATRCINLEIVNDPSRDTRYSVQVPRTSTPLKFFSTVNISVHTPGLSYICWCIPYQPAIQDISRIFETFTKPPIDPSEKVGFWDKIRLIIHTRTKISFAGGGDLAVIMKGSRNPYEMSEKGFGLAKLWRNNVVWLIGYDNPEGEFMQVTSCDYAFGVPDPVHGGFSAPYILPVATHQPDSYPSSASVSSLDSASFTKENKDNFCFTKVALKMTGGIRMGLGCQLERACNCDLCDENSDVSTDDREAHKRTLLEFSPHYKVKMKTPDNVHEEDYDAYRGFRSDFIHFSISIVKLTVPESEKEITNVIGNSMHITPGFLDHFVSWVRLFGGAMSYPLRSGPLFPKLDTRPTKKFGKHMSTLKYKIVINPLTIGCFVKDENVEAENVAVQELGDSVGLKGFVKGFSLDIHQRREIVNISNYKLDQKRLKANWPIQEAEIQLKNIDIRAVKAQYKAMDDKETHAADSISSSIEISNDSDIVASSDGEDVPDMMEGLNYQCGNDPESSEWIDLDDFVELNVDTPTILPSVQVLPFAFSPYFHYIRQTNRDDLQKFKYLHETHDCIFGTAVKTREMQVILLQDRKTNIDIQIRKHQARLHTNEMKRKQPGIDEKALDDLSDQIVEKTRVLYEKRELLQRYIKDTSIQAMPGTVRGSTLSAHSNSAIFGEDSLKQWEEHLGHFKVRCIAHNPQILWNNSLRNILYHALDLREHRRALSYYMTSRTVKFLRDLIDASHVKQTDSDDQFVLDNEEGGMNQSMVHELIEKLLSEQDTKLYAANETDEEQKLMGEHEIDEIDMSHSENINNPEMQAKSIPSNYVMKSSYLIDLLNPQISLQSDCAPDNIVLVANERIQVKGFNIIDENESDVDMESVKHRTIVSLDNLQFFVAKKEQFDSVDLLLDNHYGARESDHWLAWIPPETLISYVNTSEQFQRIGDRISATLQYDKYNQLRLKTNSSALSRIHPFEERCDSVQLSFPKFHLTADSSQYNAIYQVATDLLLYKEPAKQERLARLREIMMAADRSSLFEITEKIVDLQNRVRQLTYARDQYRHNMALLDDKRIGEFKSIRLALFDALEELYLGMEAIKLMQSNQRKDYNEPETNLKLVCSIDKLVWEMLSSGKIPLCECTLTNVSYIFVSKEDHSAINTFEVDIMQVKNTSPSPVFADVLGPYFDPRKPYDFTRHKMLRCYFVTLAPVGGIPIVQHLETNLHPLRLQMTYNFGKALAYYLFPPEKRQKQSEHAPLTSSASAPSITVNDPNIQLDTPQLAGSAITLPVTDKDTARSISSSKSTESAPAMIGNNEPHDFAIPNREDAEFDFSTDNQSSVAQSNKQTKKQKKQNSQKISKASDDLSVMKKRASSNRTFILVKIPGTRHCLSYQGPKEKNIEDLRDFAFEQPTLEFRNETWSWFELISSIKKDFMKAALLHNSTALLKEKLLRRHPRELNTISEIPLQSASVNGSKYFVQSAPKSRSLIEDHEESQSDDTEGSSDEDIVSLHSANSQDIWDAESSESNTKHSHIWSRLKKPKKPSPMPSESKKSISEGSSRRLSVDSRDAASKTSSPRRQSNSAHQFREDEQFTIKGKKLLGKYYNGPTQWYTPKVKSK